MLKIILTRVEGFSIALFMPAEMTDESPRQLDYESARYFRTELQKAREDALKDAEAFDGIIHVVEKLGQFLLGRVADLGKYRDGIEEVAKESALAAEVPDRFRNVHTPFNLLYNMVTDARNDAMHIGASARHLTQHTIELALILEDAMRTYEMSGKVSDYMVRNPVCAQLWQPISFIRQQMLTHSFTHLPVFHPERKWCLVSDFQVAKYLQVPTNKERKKRLAAPLHEAMEGAEIELHTVTPCCGKNPISKDLKVFGGTPILVGENSEAGLEGILTAFDLL
jgi:hypothetical protein